MNSGKKIRVMAGYWVPAFFMLLASLWAGAQKDPTLGLLGFLSFFLASVFLAARGWELLTRDDSDGNGPENDS
ncbi:MAG: hypothetical protein FGM27_07245 [Candidatus Omnitrophica bacterium]|nr:hypothetical protein [Candidatus Omnitrophota bacterium]